MNGFTRGNTRSRAAIGLCAIAAAVFTIPSSADMTRWHPNFHLNSGVAAGISPFWGGSAGAFMEKIDNPSVDNVVWNEGNVFYTHPYGESYYDNKHAGTADTHKLAIHNPTVDDYSTTNRITITFYSATTGTQITDTDGILDTAPTPSWLNFDTTADVFLVDVPSLETRTIVDSDFLLPGEAALVVMEIYSPKTGGGEGAFIATTPKNSGSRFRKARGDADSSFWALRTMAYRGYALPSSDDLSGLTSPMLVLPYWIDSDNGVTAKQTAYVHIANVDTVDLDIAVDVFELDGTLIKSHTFDDVAPHSRISFVPSQFLDSGDPEEGYLEAYAVQSSSPSTVGEILGVVHPVNLALVYIDFTVPVLGWSPTIKGEALTIVDNN